MNTFLEAIRTRLISAFSLDALTGKLADGAINFIVALAVFAAFYFVWRILQIVAATAFKRIGSDPTTVSFMQTVLKYTVLTMGTVSALDSAGIRTSALLTSLGIAGLTLGFAAKDALSNLISGILIFLDRPFVIGDLVEIDGRYGRVDRITLRSTRIVTVDGKMLAVPNTEVINRTVASYTNFPNLRPDIGVTIATTENIDNARAVLLNLVQGKPEFLETPAARVVVTALNDYNIALELQAWIRNEREHIPLRFALREAVFKALTDAGIEMPLETLQLASVPVELRPPVELT